MRALTQSVCCSTWSSMLPPPVPSQKKYAMKAFSAKEATPPTLDRFLRGELPHLAQETRQAAPEAPASVAPSQSQPRATSAPSVSSTPMPPPEIDLLGLDDAPTSAPAPAAGTSQVRAATKSLSSTVTSLGNDIGYIARFMPIRKQQHPIST